jgi:hypothetical protein
MHPFVAQYENRIRALDPDADLASARFNGEGLMNDVVFCGERVFRFAKDERCARARRCPSRRPTGAGRIS